MRLWRTQGPGCAVIAAFDHLSPDGPGQSPNGSDAQYQTQCPATLHPGQAEKATATPR